MIIKTIDLATQIKQEINNYTCDNSLTIVIIVTIRDLSIESYLKQIKKTAASLNINVIIDYDIDNIKQNIDKYNHDDNITGIMLQTPLADFLNFDELSNQINPLKDIDCLNPINLGKLYSRNYNFAPATAQAAFEIIKDYDLTSKHCVVIGQSNVVGKPLSLMLQANHATVTMCDKHTKNLAQYSQQADYLFVAVGKKHLITKEMVKPNSTIIDIGFNEINNQYYGDCDIENIKDIANITPVIGGIGPITTLCLFKNLVTAHQIRSKN